MTPTPVPTAILRPCPGSHAPRGPALPSRRSAAVQTTGRALTLLRADVGVIVRANSPRRRDIALIELATKHGWRNPYHDEPELVTAGWSPLDPADPVRARLARAGREAVAWLKAWAVPEGYFLDDMPDGLALLPVALFCRH